ncbi:MAG: isoleucine--tRNA ligase [Sphingobacteriales bacterium 17-39-43]|uniref:isoleucine--tRNA ligase n=1 Tax=Daejeonella sp. TaxID=2805397 RepID=UPI000BDB95A5|nr:isoleucine--tRNA ligase [Daejeonella sp.]OYZ31117.1 MAG: isoleucine--tRNA ligase [Sphingobacteriales bacterium 16-39-50]OYZ59744.1 MAG: isoleucine--tRNA ligase [Sphingobacteriales bacterium 24-40-4]OZA23958.1 MAG: isoleucine--tRNA ligase [Sphingobacteriales bacterium 17-39-43]HQT23287.1 isoleucine--tRNA ligase [Daejeonella sp.]HQT58239.1 isoleucine--tRNA ligase [Daejeonella sp.]
MYKEYKQLDLSKTGKEILDYWKQNQVFDKSISNRPATKPYIFYEGPPSANGMPGIHHVMARSIKDIFCRYKTLKGYRVERKGGWDTHGLPIELAVEKKLGITKDDIGKTISVDDYNAACRTEVMKYTDVWNDLTEKMGYWVDLENPYITYENDYIETLWWILKQFHEKGLLYKGYTVQPYSPAAGTGLSSHELNQPGTYKMLKDTSIVAQFHIKRDQDHPLMDKVFENAVEDTVILAWTTTPWTLPSNCALAVGASISYVKIRTFNPYTFQPVSVILAKDLVSKYFKEEHKALSLDDYRAGDKVIPWNQVADFKGSDLVGLRYHQLMPYVSNADLEKNAFRVIPADFVTTEDGTGIVHTASVFGADDFRAARENNVPSVMITDEKGNELPLVDKQGRFVAEVTDFAGRFVKEEYYSDEERKDPDFRPTDVLIAIKLKEDNKAFDVKKYEHSYPHCWRTDKPVLYYPLDSWFIKTTAVKDRLVELNKTINWKPESTGTGRFGNWLENLVDWNLSRSRYWGTPLPIWRTVDGAEEKCIGSVEELKSEIKKAVAAGFMDASFEINDMHRPYVDDVILVSKSGKKMIRETDLIDVWFDSGAMPYAQWGLPPTEEGKSGNISPEAFLEYWNKQAGSDGEPGSIYPADFIAEGVDQTRGWFFTLHAIGVMLHDSISFKNVVSNGLVLDKNGNKMSKRLGNAVDPFETIEKYGADPTRWYMISNASPWDNLKFNIEGIDEVRRKFFGTLHNTYAFFALYANIDGFSYKEDDIKERPEIDRWIISLLNSLSLEVDKYYADFEPTRATRAIQNFVDEHLSNWYVRLCRRRFWKGEYTEDKISAYQTLYTCLSTIAKLMSPVAPFFSDRLFIDLNKATGKEEVISVHLADFPVYNKALVDKDLEERMALAQDISSLILSLRKKVSINVRQPLSKAMIPVLDKSFKAKVEKVKDLILSETNLKSIEYITDTSGIISKKIKPNFKALGPKVGKDMKLVAEALNTMSQQDISRLENEGHIAIPGTSYVVDLADAEVLAEDVPGWQVANLGNLTVALDVTLTEELKQEGISRELVNRIQNLRKELGFEVTDKIRVQVKEHPYISEALKNNLSYICAEILADSLELVADLESGETVSIDDKNLIIQINKG